MKRLLAGWLWAGLSAVSQLHEEMGRHHNPEFTMLEWYRPHYDMYRLMNEVDDLLQQVLDCVGAETPPISRFSSVIWRSIRCRRINAAA